MQQMKIMIMIFIYIIIEIFINVEFVKKIKSKRVE